MFEEKDIQFLDKTAKAFLSIVKKIVKNYSYSKAEVDSAVTTGTGGLYSIRGSFDISGGSFPTTGGRGVGGLPKAGDGWNISVGGTAGGIVFNAGDNIVSLIDTPGQTAANWQKGEGNLGYTPENSANKENTTLDTSTSKYPTNRLVKEQVDLKQATLTEANFGTFSAALTGKTTPVDADQITAVDSEDSNKAKKITLTNFKAFLKTYFDTLYASVSASSGLVLLATRTASNSATIDFDNLLDSTYEVYKITYSGISPASDNVDLYCRFGTGATPTYQATSYRYSNTGGRAGTVVQRDSGNTTVNQMIMNDVSTNAVGNQVGEEVSGEMYIHSPANTSKHKNCHWAHSREDAADYMQNETGSGKWDSTTAVTSVRFLFASGNIASGEFKLYGIKKS